MIQNKAFESVKEILGSRGDGGREREVMLCGRMSRGTEGARQGHDLPANSHPRRLVERGGRVVDQPGPDNGIHWSEHLA